MEALVKLHWQEHQCPGLGCKLSRRATLGTKELRCTDVEPSVDATLQRGVSELTEVEWAIRTAWPPVCHS